MHLIFAGILELWQTSSQILWDVNEGQGWDLSWVWSICFAKGFNYNLWILACTLIWTSNMHLLNLVKKNCLTLTVVWILIYTWSKPQSILSIISDAWILVEWMNEWMRLMECSCLSLHLCHCWEKTKYIFYEGSEGRFHIRMKACTVHFISKSKRIYCMISFENSLEQWLAKCIFLVP